MIFDVSFFSEVGSRSENQDAVAFDNNSLENAVIACIADGVGGRQCGSFASNYATKTFIQKVIDEIESPFKIVNEISEHLIKHSLENTDCRGMATTFTACAIKNLALHVIHIGDSRICLLRGDGLKQLSEDHTEVKRLLKIGALSEETAKNYPRKNVLESALGMPPSKIKIQEVKGELIYGDRIILTTDGVHNKISKVELRDASLISKSSNEFCNKISELMKTKKPDDNYSMMAIFIK